MARNIFMLSIILLTAFAFTGCAALQKPAPPCTAALEQNVNFKYPGMQQSTDAFHVILDGSISMNGSCCGGSKIKVAKQVAKFLGKAVSNLNLKSGIRTIGLSTVPVGAKTDLLYGVKTFACKDFSSAVDTVRVPNGMSPLGLAINAASDDLAQVNGDIALIIIADGGSDDDAVAAAAKLKRKMGSRLCIYTISVCSDEGGMANLAKIAKIGGCGASYKAVDLCKADAMTAFVSKAFFKAAPPAPAPKDSDNDGITDDLDQCPNTPRAAKVNEYGCWELEGMNFDTSKSDVQAQYTSALDKLATILKQNSGLKIEIQGHTDSRGNENYNMALSVKRAEAIRDSLIDKGIDASRLSTKGFGETMPIAPNDTEENMARNRRVELKPVQ